MKCSRMILIHASALLVFAVVLAGCGGAKILKEPVPLILEEPVAVASDQRINARLEWVIVRDGPGTWAKNADWDEYLISVANPGADPVRIVDVAVVDSTGYRVASRDDRKLLVKGTKETKRRYKGEGIRVRAGLGGVALVGTGVVTAAAGAYGGAAIAFTTGASVTVGAAVVLFAPVAVTIGGIRRGRNNSKVNSEIERRRTRLPLEVPAGEVVGLQAFFPLAPSPREVRITYEDARGQDVLTIDTRAVLDGLHLKAAEE